MVTTFSPPVKPKKKKQPILPIALGAAAAVALILAIVLNGKLGSAQSENKILNTSLANIATAVGNEAATPELLADPATATNALAALEAAVAGQKASLGTAATDLESARADVTRLQGELVAAETKATEAQGKADAAARDLAASRTELNALQKKYADETAALKAQVAALEASAAAEQAPEETETADEVASEAPAVTNETAEVVAEAAPAENATTEKQVKLPDHSSDYFTSFRFKDGTLTFTTVDAQKLTYRDVPAEVVDGLEKALVFDVYYRFQVFDKYPSTPKDTEFIRTVRR